jgi:hypothetical protein
MKNSDGKKSSSDISYERQKVYPLSYKGFDIGGYIEDHTGRRFDVLTSESLGPYIGPHLFEEVEYYEFTA